MHFTPRPYQAEAITAGVDFFNDDHKKKYNAIQILPTGSGKSLVIANVANESKNNTIILQPSKEILAQNYKKFISYGSRAGIYSASAGHKFREKITFATIGSIRKKHHLFRNYPNILIDECDLVDPKDGMYHDFIHSIPEARVLGLTATPYRLASSSEGAELRFLTRTSPRIFNKVIYYVQNDVLFDAGHLAKLEYFDRSVIDRKMLEMNATGTDFTEASLRAHYRRIDMPTKTIGFANRLLAKRKNLLVFCSLIDEAMTVSKGVPGSVVLTGETPPLIRDRIINQFLSGIIKCVINVGVLTVGFDFPALEAILLARSTMSLRLYYQIIGRAMRPHPDKESAWIVDLGGNVPFFGKIETMRIRIDERGLHSIWNDGKQLTNIPFTKN